MTSFGTARETCAVLPFSDEVKAHIQSFMRVQDVVATLLEFEAPETLDAWSKCAHAPAKAMAQHGATHLNGGQTNPVPNAMGHALISG